MKLLTTLLFAITCNSVLAQAPTYAQYPSGEAGLKAFIKTNTNSPKAETSGVSGNVIVRFTVEADGSVTKAEVKSREGLTPTLDAEAVKVVQKMPKWTPMMLKDSAVSSREAVLVYFQATTQSSAVPADTREKADQDIDDEPVREPVSPDKANQEGEIFRIAEKMPQYPGGEEALLRYLGKNTRYPASAKDRGIEGKVFASFVVNKDGSITDIKIIRSLDRALDVETIRVLKMMPKWTPGEQRGKPIRVQFNIPLNFILR